MKSIDFEPPLFSLVADSSLTTCSRVDAGAGSNYTFLTLKERDNETGLDYFLARYHASTQGRFTSPDPYNIIAILKAVEAGRTVRDVCREHEVSDATYYKWKTKYGGMEAADIRRLRELEDENRRLKQMSAELLLENRALKDVIAKKL